MKKNEIGNRYGRWLVKEFYDSTRGRDRWLCTCDCGAEKAVYGSHLRSGASRSCGCLRKEVTSAIRKTWVGPKNPNWGKRGEQTSQYGRRGEKSKMWKGGRHVGEGGYIHVYVKRGEYRPEHILVMEQMLGHPLPKGAVVHHCNGDRADNRPYNLRLFGSNREHALFHQKFIREHRIKHPNAQKTHFFNRHSGQWELRKVCGE